METSWWNSISGAINNARGYKEWARRLVQGDHVGWFTLEEWWI